MEISKIFVRSPDTNVVIPYMPGVPGHNGHIIIIYCNNGKIFRIQNLHVGITRCQVIVNQVMKFWQQELSNRS